MKKNTLALFLASGMLAAMPVFAADMLGGDAWALLSPAGNAVLQPSTDHILHVTVHTPLKTYYQMELTHDVAAAVPANSMIMYHFFARSLTGNPIHAVIEKRNAPYTKIMDKSLLLTPTWKEYTFTAKVPIAYGERGLAARLQVGEKTGLIDFKSITVTTDGR